MAKKKQIQGGGVLIPVIMKQGDGDGGGGTFEQGTGYQDDTYLYVVFGVDNNWEAVRFTRDLQEKKTTGYQTGSKPTTLEEVQSLNYLYDYN